MSSRNFDIVVIGAGPCAIAALGALGARGSVAVVSGETPQSPSMTAVHPKIQAVAMSNGEPPLMAAPYSRPQYPKRPLFSSAGPGGLANYWGQQFLRYEPADPWPREVFPDYAAYEEACGAIERLFVLSGGEDVQPRRPLEGRRHLRIPRLLVGSPGAPSTDLMAMRGVFMERAERCGAQVLHTRVRSIRDQGVGCELVLEDGAVIGAGRVVLCAGVVGTSRIVQDSFPEVERQRFSDHGQWMVYTVGLGGLLSLRPKTAHRHFNALTLEEMTPEGSVRSFASIYDMGRADLNLLLTCTIGRTFKAVSRLGAPPGASLVQPVQVWTPSTYDEIELDPKTGQAVSVERPVDPAADNVLSDALTAVESLGGRCLKTGRTFPADGFHYHGLRVRTGAEGFRPVSDFLRDRTSGKVVCTDASALTHIGVRPHTLTAMALSHRIAGQIA
jgi:hypothetical protein